MPFIWQGIVLAGRDIIGAARPSEPRWGCSHIEDALRAALCSQPSARLLGRRRLTRAYVAVRSPVVLHNLRKEPKSCEPKAKQQKRSTGPSRVVPHRSTTPARTSLTSLFGWEAVSLVDMAALTQM